MEAIEPMSEPIPPLPSAPPLAAPTSSSTRSWEVLCHLSSLLGLFIGFLWIPLLNILGPLIIWLVKRNESLGVDAHGKESLNFHISWTLYGIVAIVGLFVTIIGILLIPFVLYGMLAMMIILTIIAAVKASNGELYRYPLTIRFLK
jgi:uncharacterized Tic20 family protein